MPNTSTRPLFDQIDSWMTEIDGTKTAAAKVVKQAAPAGVGKTTHPSEKVDNNTHPEETGARFAENTADIKKDVPGTSVDETSPGSGGSQDDKQYNIGTVQSATGEDPSVEDDYKGDKEDPGTTHPMDAERLGEKYSAMKLPQLLKVSTDMAHGILADLANGLNQQQVTGQPPLPQVPVKTATAPAPQASASQWIPPASAIKQAEDFVAQTIFDADQDADLVGAFVHSYHQSRQKRAADEASEGESHKEDDGGAPPAPEGDMPPGGGAPPGAGGGDVLSALGAGGGGPPPGGDMGAGAGGPPPGMGGDPSGGAGGAGGAMHPEEALQQLAMALQELGITPEELAQMAQQGGGAGGAPPGAGGPPGMGGPPPGMGGPPPGAGAEGAKLASAVKNFQRSGKFRIQEAKTAAQYQAREQIKDYVREICGMK